MFGPLGPTVSASSPKSIKRSVKECCLPFGSKRPGSYIFDPICRRCGSSYVRWNGCLEAVLLWRSGFSPRCLEIPQPSRRGCKRTAVKVALRSTGCRTYIDGELMGMFSDPTNGILNGLKPGKHAPRAQSHNRRPRD